MELDQLNQRQFDKFRTFIYEQSGIRVDDRKISLLSNRIRRRLKAGDFSDFDAYYRYLTAPQGAGELAHFLDAITTNLVDDTTPQLGGMLDVNGKTIGDGTRKLLAFTESGSAVNWLDIANAGTGSQLGRRSVWAMAVDSWLLRIGLGATALTGPENRSSQRMRAISRTTSSSRPGGTRSCSMSVTKPYLYSLVLRSSASCSSV